MTDRTLVLVHGAWHGAWCWQPVVDRLERSGIRVVAVELPFTSFEDDTAAIQAAVTDEDVVLCGHSYGGRLVSAAAGALPAVSHLVYLSSQLLNAGQLAEYARTPRATSTGIPDLDTVRGKYYNACSEADFRAAAGQLRSMVSVPGGLLGLECRPWENATSTYIVCTRDRAIEPAAQRRMAANTTYTVDIPADHAAFFSAPDELSAILAAIVGSDRP
ncbi:MAG TPA: alpha/beta fold hydrolase [Streptosporangiaceae bacterium]|jgi:pimeloyl-ACP methyl ester carboxylesterase